MAEDLSRRRLGRGLAALIGDVGAEPQADRQRSPRRLPVGFLRPNPRNPRKAFDSAEKATEIGRGPVRNCLVAASFAASNTSTRPSSRLVTSATRESSLKAIS